MAKKDYTITEINYKEAYGDLYADVARMLLKRLKELSEVDNDGTMINSEGYYQVRRLLTIEWDYLRSNYPNP